MQTIEEKIGICSGHATAGKKIEEHLGFWNWDLQFQALIFAGKKLGSTTKF